MFKQIQFFLQQLYRVSPPAVLGLTLISCCLVIVLTGRIWVSDQSPDVDRQLPAFALQNAGFKGNVIKIRRQSLITNNIDTFILEPYATFEQTSDSLMTKPAIGVNPDGKTMIPAERSRHRHIVEVVMAVDPIQPEIRYDSIAKTYSYRNDEGQEAQISKTAIWRTFEDKHVTKIKFPLGSDSYGRDLLSRLVVGAQVSFWVGLISVMLSLLIGVSLGAIAGYFGGWVDRLIMVLVNTLWTLPTLLLLFALVLALGREPFIIFLAIGLSLWVEVARLVRGQVLGIKEKEFVKAAHSLGLNRWRILFRHIAPQLVGPVLVIAASNFATAILLESGLSFLGFGVRPPTPTWGNMLHENYGLALTGRILPALAPALAIMLLVLAFNLLSNGLRDYLDPRGSS
jgi:peptide/nickel transport system permease protein